MGIYAKGEQSPATRVRDTPQDRYSDLADPNDIGGGGSALGQVIADTKATATSANDTAGSMANDLSALESRVDSLEDTKEYYLTGTGNVSPTGWVTINPVPPGWSHPRTPPVEGDYRIEIFGKDVTLVSIELLAGYGRPAEIVDGPHTNHVIGVVHVGPNRRWYARAQGSGNPVHVLIRKL